MLRFILALALAGCSMAPEKVETALRPGEVRSAQGAKDVLAIGKSTKAEVRAALGEATVVDFESGYEVWTYRERPGEKAEAAPGELVLLFDPSGILTKTRSRERPADPGRAPRSS
jgi:hypothetical protein